MILQKIPLAQIKPLIEDELFPEEGRDVMVGNNYRRYHRGWLGEKGSRDQIRKAWIRERKEFN